MRNLKQGTNWKPWSFWLVKGDILRFKICMTNNFLLYTEEVNNAISTFWGNWKIHVMWELYELRPWRDLLACEAKTIALALVLISINSLTARRWCCRAFLARFGANRLSLSTNASLNFSATDNSVELEDGEMGFNANPCIVHVLGSMSLTTSSSNRIFCNASWGTSVPLNPKGDDLGFTTTRGHSVEKSSKEFLSMFGCK